MGQSLNLAPECVLCHVTARNSPSPPKLTDKGLRTVQDREWGQGWSVLMYIQ